MAIEITPLGFQKPDGNEAVRNGDNVIAANAQRAEDEHQTSRGRLGDIEVKNNEQDGRLNGIDAKNISQDGTLSTHEARLANLDNAAGFTGDPLALNDAAFAETLTNGTATSAALDVRLTARVPPIVAAAIASDPTVASSAATMAQNTAGLVPAWKATTAYVAGQRVIAPNGDVVAAKVNFTSGASYSATNWNASTQDGRIGANELSITALDTKKVDDSDPRLSRKVQFGDYAQPFADKDGYVSGGVQLDGVWNFEKSPRVKGQSDTTLRPLNTTGYTHALTDKDGYVALGVRLDGSVVAPKLVLPPGAISDPLADANLMAGYTKSSRYRVAAIGDSLTDGYFGGVGNQDADAYPAKLQALMPAGVTVFNLGNSGYTTDEEAVRIGALPVPLTVTGGSIPASGPVDVTTTAVIGWRPSGTTRTIPGTLAGVAGTLTRSSSDTVFTFTRTTTGTAVAVTAGTLFVPDFAGHEGDTAIILLGRNNVSFSVQGADTSIAEHVEKGIARIVNWLTPQIKHVLVVSATTTTSETSGTGGYAIVADINARLAAAYPSRFLDLRTYLAHQAIYDLGLTPTTADNTAMTGDTLPPSIMDDNTHWSKATATLVAAQINNYLTTRGWV
jgi:lysophospholipase L1-like esterase